MRLLVVTLMYLPDGGAGAPLYGMLCEGMARRGHEVTVIAAVPHYPSGRVPPAYRGKWLQRTRENGVDVVRVRVPSLDRSDLKQRLLQFLGYQLGAVLAGRKQDFDVALFANPALEVGLPFAFLSRLGRKPAVFSVHDVYPDVGITLGIFRHPAVVAAVGALERFCLQRSRYVRVLSESFIRPLGALGVPAAKIHLIYDWVDTELIRPLPRDNGFAREQGLSDNFVVLYAGNLGFSQGLEQVLLAAQLLQEQREIKFVLVGEGAGKESLMRQAARLALANVQFVPFQPRSRLPEVLATADVSLVPLQKNVGLASLPSKSFSILASGRPLIAGVDEASDTRRLVERSGGGLGIPPEDPAALAQAIVHLKENPDLRQQMGRRGRQYALRHHSSQAAAAAFEQLLQAALATSA